MSVVFTMNLNGGNFSVGFLETASDLLPVPDTMPDWDYLNGR
jgi:hypothetical protein